VSLNDRPAGQPRVTIRAIFAGRRGRLLAALLFAEFGSAMQGIAYSSVLPIASRELDGSYLYGAVVVAGSFTTIAVLAFGGGVFTRMGAKSLLLWSTLLYVVGVMLCAGAQTMGWILLGVIVRGLSAGILAGFGLTAIGALYEDSLRHRVLGLYAIVWLLPTLAGPTMNALVTVMFGWRAAMAWPAFLIVFARVLIGRDVVLVPWNRGVDRKLGSPVPGALLLVGLILCAVAPNVGGVLAVAMVCFGLLASIIISIRLLFDQVGISRFRFRRTVAFFGLCLAYFGASIAVPLAVIADYRFGILASSVAVGSSLITWSLSGLLAGAVDRWVREPIAMGMILLALGLMLMLSARVYFGVGTTSFVILVSSWSVSGFGMGLAYPRLSSKVMDEMETGSVHKAAIAVQFAESSGYAVGVIVGGGLYSLMSSLGVGVTTSLNLSLLLLIIATVGSGCVLRVSMPRAELP